MDDEMMFDINNGVMLPILWAMEPLALQQLLGLMQARMKSGLAFGPVNEGARAGLPIRDAGGGTAVISLNGPMTKGESFFTFFGFGTSTDALRAAFHQALVDSDIRNILFKITSPGGSVESIADLADVVAEVNAAKPVVAQVEGQAASAAFFVGSQAGKIFSGRGDMVGSIGVKTMLFDFSAAFEKEGIKAIPIDTGAFKSLGAMGIPVTAEQIEHIQLLVDQNFDMFIEAVVRGRQNMDEKQVRAVSDGRMFMAADALKLGLIDGIATLDQTLASLRTEETTSTTESVRHRHKRNRRRAESRL